MSFGFGIGFGNGINNSSSGSAFSNLQAQAYWNALTVANGDVEVDGALYGITTAQLKSAIDTFFITGDTDGWLALAVLMYPIIGGTSATHGINAMNPATAIGTFVASPTHGSSGVTMNGTSQYMNCNNNPSTDGILADDCGLTTYVTNSVGGGTGTRTISGSYTSSSFRLAMRKASTTLLWDAQMCNSSTGVIPTANSDFNKVVTATRRSATDAEFYIDGVSVGTSVTGTGGLPTHSVFVCANNSAGTAAAWYDGNLKFHMEHKGISDAQALSIRNAIITFNTTLGR